MLLEQHSFVVPDSQDISELVSLLENNFPVQLRAGAVNNRVFYDTFDWRLYKHGSALEKQEEGSSRKIYWRAGKQDRLKLQLGLSKVPPFASELPDSEFRQQLQSVISVRELMPRVSIRVKRQPLVVVDDDDKVVVRLSLDKYLYTPSKTRAARVLGQRLTLQPVKGYLERYQQVEEFLKTLKLYPTQDNMMKLALVAKGVNAGEYSTKLNILLEPDMPAEQALKKILLRLLEIMQQNTAGCIRGRDTEFMHDFRVSIRKTRSALKQVKDVLPQEVSSRYRKFFSMLGKLTNPVRDFDVFLRKLESYQSQLSNSEKQQVQALRDYISASRTEAQDGFVEVMKSSQCRQSIKQWRGYLESGTREITPADNDGKMISRLADELVWEAYQQALEQGNAIVDDSSAETLHELRKTFKKLRYLIEFFRSLYPTQKLGIITHALTALQDNLGDINDLNVHIDIIKGFIKQGADEDASSACMKIIKTLEKLLHSTRAEFADCYAVFSSAENYDNFREMFIDYHAGQ